jgi:hypothetical protein
MVQKKLTELDIQIKQYQAETEKIVEMREECRV